MSEIEPGLESVPTPERPPVAIREGLPPAYRMRADAHYVDQLDAPASPSVRLIDARTIEVRERKLSEETRVKMSSLLQAGFDDGSIEHYLKKEGVTPNDILQMRASLPNGKRHSKRV